MELHIDADVMTNLLGMPAYVGMDINSKGQLCEIEYILKNLSKYQKINITYAGSSSERIVVESSNGKYEEIFIDDKDSKFSIDLKDYGFPDSVILRTADKTKYNCLHISSIEFYSNNGKKIVINSEE